jgi:hypothetical protein
MKVYSKELDSCLKCPNCIRVMAEREDINYNPHLCHPMGRTLPSVVFVDRHENGVRVLTETAIIPPDWCPLPDKEGE